MFNRLASRAMMSLWAKVPQGPADPILGVALKYRQDTDANKVNLSVGAYRDNLGKPVVLESVRKAQNIIVDQVMDNEYLAVEGLQSFIDGSIKLAYGPELYAQKIDNTAGIQVLSGTGAIRLGFEFMARYLPQGTSVYIPNPTWPNHVNIARDSHFSQKEYRYFDPSTKGVHFNAFMEDLKAMPSGSVVLLHACAHNPTGCDLTFDQWKLVKEVVVERKLIPFFDMAYQGFTTGDTNIDAAAVRLFAQDTQVVLGQSFAKNMGLYGQRCGTLSFICGDAAEKERVMSQLRILARPIWSSPPAHGARIASIILNTPELNAEWLVEVKQMALRISKMRNDLYNNLVDLNSPHDWSHIKKQIGMFAFTGLNADQVKILVEKYHIYLLSSGRISIAGLNDGNVKYVANAFHQVTKDSKI